MTNGSTVAAFFGETVVQWTFDARGGLEREFRPWTTGLTARGE